jgi:hypothetical protein
VTAAGTTYSIPVLQSKKKKVFKRRLECSPEDLSRED